MTAAVQEATKENLGTRLLRGINLRPGEGERTFWMFASYAATSVGVLWLEATASALFLERYKADNLPFIYLASTLISILLGALYGRLQTLIPLRWMIVCVGVLMALPMPLFLVGLESSSKTVAIAGLTLVQVSVLSMRLWQQVIYVLSDLNTSITANQLFNIREIKRTYPLISSGVLVADVISGFSLPLVLNRMGLGGAIWVAFIMMLTGAGILLYITQRQQRYFRSSLRREASNTDAAKQLQGQSMSYRWLLLAFFVLAESMFLLVDFQFSKQLENLSENPLALFGQRATDATQGEKIAGFLGLFQGVLGILELVMQWVLSRRILESLGIFSTSGLLPGLVVLMGTWVAVLPYVPILGQQLGLLFWTIVVLKFFYELIHFTLLASVSPVLFQPIPERWRNSIQAEVRGSAEPIATGITGAFLLVSVWLGWQSALGEHWRSLLFVIMVLLAGVWIGAIWLIRRDYVQILVLSARQDQLGMTSNPATIRELKRAAIAALSRPGMEDSRLACIELLLQIDRRNAPDILAPMLLDFPPKAQCRVLQVMLDPPNPEYLVSARRLINFSSPPEVVGAALRYVFVSDPHADLQELSTFLMPQAPAAMRGTAAALLLELGNPKQKAEATNVLRLMLTHRLPEEREQGCKAIRNLKYLQALQIYVSEIIKKEQSLGVRRSVLEVIAATRYEKGYPALIDSLANSQTRQAAMQALIALDQEVLPRLQTLVNDWRQPAAVRSAAWTVIGQINTPEALEFMVDKLTTSWGEDRAHILRSLLKVPKDEGIEAASEKLGRTGLEMLIEQELMLIGQTNAAILDLSGQVRHAQSEDMLRRSLYDVQADCIDRLFMLMQFLYEPDVIQAAAFNLRSGSADNMAQGLEILDNKLDIPHKRALLSILEHSPRTMASHAGIKVKRTSTRLSRQEQMNIEDQLQSLAGLINYVPLEPSDRLIHLLDLRHFLSDWVVTCGFHLARAEKWQLARHHVLGGLRSSSSFLREAALHYLKVVYPHAFLNVLPRLQNDPEVILREQVREMMQQMGITPRSPSAHPNPDDDDDMPTTAIFGSL